MDVFSSLRTRPRRRRRRTAAALLALLAAVALAGSLAACGVDESGAGVSGTPTPGAVAPTEAPGTAEPSPGADSASGDDMAVRVYFLRGEKLGVAERQVPKSDAVATAAVTALCLGVNADEKQAGLGSAVPAGTELLGLDVEDGVATVDLTGDFASGGGSLSMQARVAQVVYTLTQYPTVKSVAFKVNGEPVTALGGEGLVLDTGQTRADWRDFEPNIFVERPGVGATVSSPFVLEGTAMVFEGSFMAELADADGKQLVKVPVQASAGGPERGDFRESLAYDTSASSGTLIVYDLSAEDGSRRDEVRIPVGFAR